MQKVNVPAILVLLVLLVFGASGWAQVVGGTITGTVTDPSAALVPGATIKIQNTATGIERSLTSNAAGAFTAPNLNPGNYVVVAEASGFTAAKRAIVLTVGQDAVIDLRLGLQSQTEVTVAETAPTVELGSSTLNSAVGGRQVRELPLNGRDWTMLAALQPNVHTVDTQVDIALGNNARGNRGWGAQLMIGGNRPQQNAYRLDGVVMNDYSGGGPGGVLGSSLGVDAIQEFSVITGNAGAEYGRSSGGVVNAVTRAGTNEWHGSAYEFLRNSALDARNYFDAGSTPPFRRNQFGGSLGGPVYKNHTFFFFNYEGLRQGLSLTNSVSVPSTDAHNGLLCVNSACASKTQVAINPKVAPFVALYPLPNMGEKGDVGTFRFVGNTAVSENLYTTRIDHHFSDRDSINGTYQDDHSFSSGPDAFNFTRLDMLSTRKLVSLQDSHFLTPSLANFARVGYSRSVSRAPDASGAIDPRASDPALGFMPGMTVGVMTIPGLTTFQGGANGQSAFIYSYNSYQLYDDVFWTHGRHSIKFGASLERIQSNDFSSPQAGNWMFGSYKNFLLDQPTSFTATSSGNDNPIYLRQSVVAGYIDDDWRVLPRLTLNLGVRYEMATVPTERYNRLTTLPSLTAAQPKLGSPYFNNPTTRNFSPRVGFSWDPFGTGKTAVRGGFGIYDNLPLTYQFGLLALNSAPYYLTGTVSSGLSGKFPNQAFSALTPKVQKYSYVQQDPGRMYVMQWNLNVQRELPWSLTAMIGYNGAHGVHTASRANDENIVLPTSILADGTPVWPSPRGSGTRQNPNVGTIDALIWNGSSIYHGGQFSLTRQQKGVRLGTSFTWSKSIDDSSSSVGGSNFNNSLVSPLIQFPALFRAVSDFDQRHNLTVNALYEVPRLKWQNIAANALGGWEVGGIYRIAAGLPFTPTIGGDPLGLNNNNAFGLPDRLFTPGCSNLVNSGNPAHYIKTECFVFPSTPRLGNSRRNDAFGPGVSTLDFTLVRNIHLSRVSERMNLQFRAEAFNALNHTNFRTPDRTASQIFNVNGVLLQNAGVINSTATTSRQLQFALKLIF